jgi:hypothetical protein
MRRRLAQLPPPSAGFLSAPAQTDPLFVVVTRMLAAEPPTCGLCAAGNHLLDGDLQVVGDQPQVLLALCGTVVTARA